MNHNAAAKGIPTESVRVETALMPESLQFSMSVAITAQLDTSKNRLILA